MVGAPMPGLARRRAQGGRGGAINWKRVIIILAVLLALIFVIKDPDGAARFVHGIWDGLVNIADQLGEFVRKVAE